MHFASCPPYTFTMLRSQWKSLKPELKPLFKEQSLCRSLGGVPIPLLTIGNEEYTNKDIEYVLDDSKKIILIVGRAHPGEAPSSFMIQVHAFSHINLLATSSERLPVVSCPYHLVSCPTLFSLAGTGRCSRAGPTR